MKLDRGEHAFYSAGVDGEARCEGCGALVPAVDGPQHPYIAAAPGCWATYCSLQDWTAALSADDAVTVVQDLVDAYAVQHATNPDRRNRQSVAVHLMSLCAAADSRLDGRQRRTAIARWTHQEYPALQPAPRAFEVTAPDVASSSPQTRSAAVERMAATTWAAWATHHETIRSWLASPWR